MVDGGVHHGAVFFWKEICNAGKQAAVNPLQHDKTLVKYDKTITNNKNCGLKWNEEKNSDYRSKGLLWDKVL